MNETGVCADLALYPGENGSAHFFVRTEQSKVWLSLSKMAELFQTSESSLASHIKNVLAEGELCEAQTSKEELIVQAGDASRERKPATLYNLDMILAIGYRVQSPGGALFRQWASTQLKQYLIKGFVIDQERLEGNSRWDYFDELLERIRDIRSSEKRFYQKLSELFALSIDNAEDPRARDQFFAEVQDKIFFAVSGYTPAELISLRADPDQPNLGQTSWKSGRVRRADVTVAKNYLQPKELDHLNRIVSLFLEFAELCAMRRQHLRMVDWRGYLDNFLEFNEKPVLRSLGRVNLATLESIANERYAQFDAFRRRAEALAVDREEMQELTRVEKRLAARETGIGETDVG